MRPSLVVLGIRNIFPLIKTECPQTIYYPHRFASLSGYRIAIDATLLVTRFHFANDTHPARHLIGFHRLIASLRSSNVFPIFVFDHASSRLTAKDREAQRRREARGKVRGRLKIEMRRAQRLKELNRMLRRIQDMEQKDKDAVSNLLKLRNGAASNEKGVGDPAIIPSGDRNLKVDVDEEVINSQVINDWSTFQLQLDQLALLAKQGRPPQDPCESTEISSIDAILAQLSGDVDTKSGSPVSENSTPEGNRDAQYESDQWHTIYEEQTSPSYAIAARIEHLRQEFYRVRHAQQGAAASRAHPTVSSPPAVEFITHTALQIKMDQVEEKLYNALMSGSDLTSLQEPADLTLKMVEAKMNESIQEAQEADVTVEKSATEERREGEGQASSTAAAAVETSPELSLPASDKFDSEPVPSRSDQPLTSLELVQEQSRTLRTRYARSTSTLTRQAFDDCATLCSLLQVPVLRTGSGSPHGGAKGEAEALAANLVTLGEADAVATEDSDVLLAEVPLIRHLTGLKDTMEVVDSRAVRVSLFPIKEEPTASGGKKIRPSKAGGEEKESPAEEDADSQGLIAASEADERSRYAMLELALLCGTDFNRTIPGLASRGALKLLREHGTIRGMLNSGTAATSKYKPPKGLDWKEYGAELSKARSIFKNPPDAKRALRVAGVRASSEDATTVDGHAETASGSSSSSSATTMEERGSGFLQIPQPPPVSLLDGLKLTLAASRERRTQDSDDSQNTKNIIDDIDDNWQIIERQTFEIPEFDRHAVRSFLRSKGFGTGRSKRGARISATSSTSQSEAEEFMLSEGTEAEAAEGEGRGEEANQSSLREGVDGKSPSGWTESRLPPSSQGFGKVFGQSARVDFHFDGSPGQFARQESGK